jgi:hypothetical protein
MVHVGNAILNTSTLYRPKTRTNMEPPENSRTKIVRDFKEQNNA